MGIWKRLKSILVKSDDDDVTFEELFEDYRQVYLKSLAIDKSAEFLARIFSKSDFIYTQAGRLEENEWGYLLNVRPNLDESASRFWQRLVYQLITQNEVLVVLSDDNQLLIADSYVREESALYDDVFHSVVVKGYRFHRRFAMGDVIFLQYNNNRLSRYLDELFVDYHKLYQRMVEFLARNNQIRGVLKVRGATQFNKEQTEKVKKYSERLFKAFSDRSVAIVPTMDGLDYQELSNSAGNRTVSVDELQKLKRQFENDVADILGVPNAILHGDMANLEHSQQVLVQFCLEPLTKKIQDELNAKLMEREDYVAGNRVKVISQDYRNLFDLASSIDKLISSGAFSRNEIRAELDYMAIEGGDEFIMTKNYEKMTEGDGRDEDD